MLFRITTKKDTIFIYESESIKVIYDSIFRSNFIILECCKIETNKGPIYEYSKITFHNQNMCRLSDVKRISVATQMDFKIYRDTQNNRDLSIEEEFLESNCLKIIS